MTSHLLTRSLLLVCGLLLCSGCMHHRRGGPLDCAINGCCNRCANSGGEEYPGCDCGEAYYGDWHSHPPACNPCDCHGNNVGAGGCYNCEYLNRGGCESVSSAQTGCGGACEGGCGTGHAPSLHKLKNKHHGGHVTSPGCATCGQ